MGKRCGNCENGKWLNTKEAVPEICIKCEYVFGEPNNWKQKTITNADRIRAMSDEELAKWLCGGSFMSESVCCYCENNELEHCNGEKCTNENDTEVIIRWLKKPLKPPKEG